MYSEKDFNAAGLVHFVKADEPSKALLQQTFDTMTAQAASDPGFQAWEFLNVFLLLRSRALVAAAGSPAPWWKAFPYNVRSDAADTLYSEWKSLQEEK